MLKKLELELKLRGFSDNTLNNYVRYNNEFLNFVKKKPEQVSQDDIKAFFADQRSKKFSTRTISLKRSALRFFYHDVLKKPSLVDIGVLKIPKTMPHVLSIEEIKSLIGNAGSYKTKIIIQLLYASGLRVFEVAQLGINDLNLGEHTGWVRAGKGAKDRAFILSETLSEELKKYTQTLDPNEKFLFPGQKSHISVRNIQKIIQYAAKKAGINKKVSPHILRHSFATHLLDNGVDIRRIQVLLGHEHLDTTQIYTKVSTKQLKEIKSPLDMI